MTKELDYLEYGKWYPIEEYYKRSDKLDWALVQFKETKTGFMPLPYRAEFLKHDGVWITHSEQDRYLCEMCEPIAFMLWKPYGENSSLEAIDNAKPSEALECVDVLKEDGCITTLYQGKALETIRQALLKAQDQEKENEILKEIIKCLFERGCPLHQYIDKDFGLTIEVDNECSIMHLGKFKGIDLDEKLNEILKNLIY